MDNQAKLTAAKRAVLDYQAALDAAPYERLEVALTGHLAKDALYHATRPFDDQLSPADAAATIWAPIRRAFAPLQRRQDIFFAGFNDLDGGATTWVVSMGHLLGLFDAPFCGVRPTRQATMLRYCEFYLFNGDEITEVTLFLDVMNFMAHAGAEAMPKSTAATMVTPG
ncbi:MAG: nuclear transport factor 2 family protein, partial [Pseudomonadota bacterium]